MKRTSRSRKVVDDTTVIRCVSGTGILREEVWQDDRGEVIHYNLAFINHLLCGVDNGRVLGYDNSHGFHHRHCKGSVTSFEYKGYDVLLDTFLAEVASLRKEKA